MTTEAKVWDGTQWRTGVRFWDPGSYYPSRPAAWVDLTDPGLAPARWTFDANNEGWTDDHIPGNPLEWSPTDGRVLGTISAVPSFFAGYSYAYSPYVKLLGPGPFKVRATVAAGINSGHVEASDTKSMRVELHQSGWMSDTVLATAEDTTLTGAWTVLETGLWTPENPAVPVDVKVCASITYNTPLFPPYGDATWRVHVNDATVLHADGSQAMRIITPAKVGKAWDGTRWVDFV
jgi:hypothetical protein